MIPKFTAFYETQLFITVYIRHCQWFLSWARLSHSVPLYEGSYLIVFSHACYLLPSFHSPSFNNPNDIWWRVQITKISFRSIPKHHIPFRFLGPSIPSILSSNSLSCETNAGVEVLAATFMHWVVFELIDDRDRGQTFCRLYLLVCVPVQYCWHLPQGHSVRSLIV